MSKIVNSFSHPENVTCTTVASANYTHLKFLIFSSVSVKSFAPIFRNDR